jgi:glycosyltransferase involved in cell wall biosynthesis
LDRCYKSLKNQTYTNWEWVVVNDGSTDGTDEYFKKINDKRIKYITYKENKGRAYARTCALENCQGDWIVVWDADDIHFPDRLEKINMARNAGYDFFCSYTIVVNNKFKIKAVRGYMDPKGCLPRMFMHPTLACKKDIACQIGYDSIIPTYGGIGEDVRIILVLSNKYNGYWLDDAPSVYFEDHELNLRKAIDGNKSKLLHFKALCKDGIISGNKLYYCHLIITGKIKIWILNLLKLYPDTYRYTTLLRSNGKILHGESLAERIKLVQNSNIDQLLW